MIYPAPNYVYVASSWRNPFQADVCASLRSTGIDHYDFKNPDGGTGFSWRDVKSFEEACSACGREVVPNGRGLWLHRSNNSVACADGDSRIAAKGSDWERVDEYLAMVSHPRAIEGFDADFAAMERADTFVLVLPCGKSAHLELGWAVGAGKRTAILLEDPVEPELMYRMVDHLATSIDDLLAWMTGSI